MGKDNETTVDTTPWGPMQGHILGAASGIGAEVHNNSGNLREIAGGISTALPHLRQMAFGQQPGLTAATNYANDVLGGRYLSGNPHLEGMLNQTRQNVGNQVNSTFSMAGRTGGGNHAERLGQGLANAENSLRYQDYGEERNRMAQAGALAPSLSAAQYSGIQPWLAASQMGATLPYAGIQNLAPLLGQASGAGQSTQTQPSNLLGNIMGGIGAALPFIFSDERLKDDVKYTGRQIGGVPEATFKYSKESGLPQNKQRGVIAQDVAALRPDALGPLVGGFLTVVPEKL